MIFILKTSVAAGSGQPSAGAARRGFGRVGARIVTLSLLAALAACGQKGALTLPTAAPAASAAPAMVAK